MVTDHTEKNSLNLESNEQDELSKMVLEHIKEKQSELWNKNIEAIMDNHDSFIEDVKTKNPKSYAIKELARRMKRHYKKRQNPHAPPWNFLPDNSTDCVDFEYIAEQLLIEN